MRETLFEVAAAVMGGGDKPKPTQSATELASVVQMMGGAIG